jgi:hypothetical protein
MCFDHYVSTKSRDIALVRACCAVAYFSRHALYSRYYDGCNHHESYDSRPLLYSKTESKYWYLDYWTVQYNSGNLPISKGLMPSIS